MTGRKIIIDFEVPGCNSDKRTEADDIADYFENHCKNLQELLNSQGIDFQYAFKVEKQ